MGPYKSLDDSLEIIAALLSDVCTSYSEAFTPRALRLTIQKIGERTTREGLSFLTKALPRLGKAFDKALSGEVSFDYTGFIREPGTNLPKFLGELFKRVFSLDARVLPAPCVRSIATIRQILYLFYKYELPYEREQEQEVISKFRKTEEEVKSWSALFTEMFNNASRNQTCFGHNYFSYGRYSRVITKARTRLARLFAFFDEQDIYPGHGPGAVSSKEKLWEKWTFRNVPSRITDTYPLDAYFYASKGHVCDSIREINSLSDHESSARVILVPKDSRGPRLISCEPLEFQWIQQGLSRAIVKLVESSHLTKFNVNFTDQQPNRRGALLGSCHGAYATLDLNEASDRVSVGLVKLLFPEPVLTALLNSRSLSTELPGGEVLPLDKFAPMGSALCFPILALTVWAILSAGAPDADTQAGILVYGDDVIVPTAYAENAIELLEIFGLKVNRDKSCTRGFFRESCGMDAYRGVDVTPVRLRTVWSSSRCPHVYSSWISYANSFYDKQYTKLYELIARRLHSIYGDIPSRDAVQGQCPALARVPETSEPKIQRSNLRLQRREVKCWVLKPVSVRREIDGWRMLLRFFAEGCRHRSHDTRLLQSRRCDDKDNTVFLGPHGPTSIAFSVSTYTKRKQVKLVKRYVEFVPLWRRPA